LVGLSRTITVFNCGGTTGTFFQRVDFCAASLFLPHIGTWGLHDGRASAVNSLNRGIEMVDSGDTFSVSAENLCASSHTHPQVARGVSNRGTDYRFHKYNKPCKNETRVA
jgi:hypothetical protein